MADLGLDALTDDQLVELHTAAYAEMMRRATQSLIDVAQRHLNDAKRQAEEAQEILLDTLKVRREAERAALHQEIAKEVDRAYAAGELTLIPREEELDLIAAAAIEAELALIEAELRKIETGNDVAFCLQLTRDHCFVAIGRRISEARLPRPQEAARIFELLRNLLVP